jgi:hypothetical protein
VVSPERPRLTERRIGREDGPVDKAEGARFLPRALAVGLYAAALAYLEAAVVVYLQRALAIEPTALSAASGRSRPAARWRRSS